MRVTECRTHKAVQVEGFNYVKVHHSQLAQPGCCETHTDIKPDTTGPHYEDSAPDEIGLAAVAPGAHGPSLTSAGLRRWLDCVVPRHREPVADDTDVRTVSAVDRSADSNVPVAS